ncbi:hypothetical protein ACFYWY_01685 [Streptomyces sp. NPDC002870]|uniref:hypothetical protein n=1 Tax=Streptomyces sp. NPDC002870 TaxID=3364666 RepID=UPI0036758F40
MAWRDRLRRRAAGTDTADRPRRTERSGASAAGPSGEGPDRGAPGDPGPSVPDDWDGGWRRTPPPELTVSRAPLGVSDGLEFRAGLAAWQNPSFDAGLGHALLPTAPTGLVRGVTRPAAPQPTLTGGGPLLLRTLRPEGADGPQDGTSDAGAAGGATRSPATARTPQVSRRVRPGARPSGPASSGSVPSDPVVSAVRPSRSGSGGAGAGDTASGAKPVVAPSGDNSVAGKGRSAEALQARGIAPADSPAVLASSTPPAQRSVEPGAAPVVNPAESGRPSAARDIPLVRRVAVLTGAAADAGLARPASGGPATAARPSAPGPDSGSVSRASGGSGGRTSSGPAVQRTATGTSGPQSNGAGSRQPEASRASSADVSQVPVQLRSVGPRLTVARRPAGPARPVPALRPAATPAPGSGTVPDAPGPASAPAGTSAPSTTPAQRSATRTGSRAPLGAPLTELPSTVARLAQGTRAPGSGSASGPALPVVQRQTDDTSTAGTSVASDGGVRGTPQEGPAPRRTADSSRSGARARGGLGAPLPALPPSADVPGSGASGARASRPAAPGPNIQRAPARPDVQRAPAGEDWASVTPPASSAADRDGMPTVAPPLTGSEAGADAPLLGAVDVQRRLADHPSTGGATEHGPADHENGPATPLVTPSQAAAPEGTQDPAGNARRPGATSDGPGPGGQRPRLPRAPGPVVVARALAEGTGDARPPAAGTPSAPAAPRPRGTAGAADPRPRTVTGSGAHSAPAAPRTLQLLPARPLTLNTRTPEGVARPTASRSGTRPVVAMRWPGEPAASGGDPAPHTGVAARPTPGPAGGATATPRVQRAVSAHGPQNSGGGGTSSAGSVQRVPVVKPAPHHQTSGTAAAPAVAVPARSLPVTAPQAPPLADRPTGTSAPAPAPAPAPGATVPVVRPRTATPGGGTGGAALPVQRAVYSADDSAINTGTPKELPSRGRRRSASAAGDLAEPKAEPAKTVPARGQSRSDDTSSASGKRKAHRAESPQDPGLDLDDLARRLLDPMARLLRTELRRGRERTGRPYDGRR